MCGFFGCYHKKDLNFNLEKFKEINDFLTHSGPDHTGIAEHSINNYFLKLGHKRLSIIGLNKYGNQGFCILFLQKYIFLSSDSEKAESRMNQ